MTPGKKLRRKKPATGKAPAQANVSASRPAPPRRQEGCYVYGVIASGAPPACAKSSLGGVSEDVYTVHHGGLAAVVSRAPAFILDPTRENALAHEHVLETVLGSHTVVPMSFGAVFRKEDSVREFLRALQHPLQEALRRLQGKLEFGLKVVWDRDRIVDDLKRGHDEIRRFLQELARKRLESAYFARVQLGRMMEKALAELAAGYTADIQRELRAVSVAACGNKPIGDKMILNAAYLVPRERQADFDAAVARAGQKFHDRLNFKYTGPWPPYNFVNIRLKLERGKAG
ncbi:MAG TPA: GvpL/GvpF family gas vesicle protein [Candidatus Angelobacter sp.]